MMEDGSQNEISNFSIKLYNETKTFPILWI